MRNTLVVAFSLLMLASSAFGQSKKVKMGFTKPDDDSRDIQRSVEAKLILTERYTVTELKAADIVTDIECMRVGEEFLFCAISVYLSPTNHGLMAIEPPAIIRGKPDYVASKTFESIVSATTDEKVKTAWYTFLSSVKETCEALPESCSSTTSMAQ